MKHIPSSIPGALALLAVTALPASAGLLDGTQPASADDGILSVNEAFQPQTAIFYEGELVIGVTAAPGAYLYRSKFEVTPVDPPHYGLGSMKLEPGEKIHDEHFGDVEVYRKAIEAHFHPGGSHGPRTLRITYQGCLENKVCYPPQSRDVEVISP